MHLHRSSAVGQRFPASGRQGHDLKPSARVAGIGKQTAYRWLREAFVGFRKAGVGVVEAPQQLGYSSPLVLEWERARLAAGPDPRHHRAHEAGVEETLTPCSGKDHPPSSVSSTFPTTNSTSSNVGSPGPLLHKNLTDSPWRCTIMP